MDDTQIGTITRQPVARSAAVKAQWFYVYAVNGTSIGNSLSAAKAWARRRGLRPVLAWEARAAIEKAT